MLIFLYSFSAMGRRKQLNPIRRTDEEDPLLVFQPSTSGQTSPTPSTSQTPPKSTTPSGNGQAKAKKFSDFSITTTLKRTSSSKPSDDLASAQKAYQV